MAVHCWDGLVVCRGPTLVGRPSVVGNLKHDDAFIPKSVVGWAWAAWGGCFMLPGLPEVGLRGGSFLLVENARAFVLGVFLRVLLL